MYIYRVKRERGLDKGDFDGVNNGGICGFIGVIRVKFITEKFVSYFDGVSQPFWLMLLALISHECG